MIGRRIHRQLGENLNWLAYVHKSCRLHTSLHSRLFSRQCWHLQECLHMNLWWGLREDIP